MSGSSEKPAEPGDVTGGRLAGDSLAFLAFSTTILATIVSPGSSVAGGASWFAALIPVASVFMGAVNLVTTPVRILTTGINRKSDSDEVKALRQEFRKAAGSHIGKQALSTIFAAVAGFCGLSFLANNLSVTIYGAPPDASAAISPPVSVALAGLGASLVAGLAGLWTLRNDTKMNECAAAIKAAKKQTTPQSAPPAPAA